MRFFLSFTSVLCLAGWSPGQSCSLVADLFGGLPRGSKPSAERAFNGGIANTSAGMIRLGGKWLFVGENEPEGRELRATDGTVLGTSLVKDIRPGPGWSSPSELVECGGRVFFRADDGVHGRELWVTDGTAAGTTLVRDLSPGAAHSHPEHLVCLGNAVYFSAARPAEGAELWCSDGTANGTRLVADLRPGASGSDIAYLFADAASNQLFFAADDGVHGLEPFVSRGTAATTQMIVDLRVGAGGSAPGAVRKVGSVVVFVASRAAEGREIWRSNGTAAGTALVADIWPGAGSGGPNLRDAGVLGGFLYFAARDGSTGVELWRTDGTASGTTQVADINPGPWHGNPFGFHVVGSGFYFSAVPQGTVSRLYWFDGANVNLIPSLASGPGSFFSAGSEVFFTAFDGRGRELWAVDHPTRTVRFVRDIHAQGSSNPEFLADLGGGRVLLRADAGHLNGIGDELFESDGSPAGTMPFLDLHPGTQGNLSSSPRDAGSVEGRTVLFGAGRQDIGVELYRTDAAGRTALLADLWPGPESSHPQGFTSVFDGQVRRTVFWATTDVGVEPWVTDGTRAGTLLLRDIGPGVLGNVMNPFVGLGNLAYFPAGDRTPQGQELWVTDGTPAGTRPIGDFNPGQVGSFPIGMVASGGRLFYSAYSPGAGRELWTSDGTIPGTRLVRDLVPGFASSDPSEIFAVGDRVVFRASTPAAGAELFVSDGSSSGTFLLRDFLPGTGSGNPRQFALLGDRVVFMTTNAVFEFELWISDLTAGGTVSLGVVDRINFPPDPPNPIIGCGDRVFFAARGPSGPGSTTGEELWVTDGTQAGTRLVADLSLGSGGSSPRDFVRAGGGVFFAAAGDVYFSAGTASTTRRVCGLNSGIANPTSMVVSRGVLYFAADGSFGREWYRVDGQPGSVEVLGTDCGSVASELRSSDPQLGTTLELRGRGAVPAGTLVVAPPALPQALPGVVASNCMVWGDLAGTVLLPQQSGPAWSMRIAIPNQPSLLGLQVAMQSAYSPAPLSLSNGLLLTMGR